MSGRLSKHHDDDVEDFDDDCCGDDVDDENANGEYYGKQSKSYCQNIQLYF